MVFSLKKFVQGDKIWKTGVLLALIGSVPMIGATVAGITIPVIGWAIPAVGGVLIVVGYVMDILDK